MATQTRQIAAAYDGAAEISIEYDDLTNAISSLVVKQDGPGTLTVTLRDPETDAVVFGPLDRQASDPKLIQAVLGRSLVPTTYIDKNGTHVALEIPYELTWSWVP
jgi:hypothetical protein